MPLYVANTQCILLVRVAIFLNHSYFCFWSDNSNNIAAKSESGSHACSVSLKCVFCFLVCFAIFFLKDGLDVKGTEANRPFIMW